MFIPDTPAEHSVPHAAGSDAGAPATIGRQLRGDAAVARVEGASTSAVGLDVQEYGPHADAMPEWWRPSPRLHVSPAYKQEVRGPRRCNPVPCTPLHHDMSCSHTSPISDSSAVGAAVIIFFVKQAERNAQRILRELEDRKLAGQDYSITDLVRLRQVIGPAVCACTCCHHRGCRMQVYVLLAAQPVDSALPQGSAECPEPRCAQVAERQRVRGAAGVRGGRDKRAATHREWARRNAAGRCGGGCQCGHAGRWCAAGGHAALALRDRPCARFGCASQHHLRLSASPCPGHWPLSVSSP